MTYETSTSQNVPEGDPEGPTVLEVHVQPRAARTEAVGWFGGAAKIRVGAPPVDGAANDELVRFVSKKLGIPRSAVQIVSGATSRRKRLAIDGVSRSEVLKALGLGGQGSGEV